MANTLENVNVVVTGANRGIGLEFCRQYLKAGAKVFALCRSSSKALADLPLKIIEGIDVSSAESLTRLNEEWGNTPVDILVNNAGVFKTDSIEDMDFDAMALQFQVNALGPLRISQALLGHFTRNAKIAMITSRMGSISDNTSGAYYGYRMSKAALNAGAMSLAMDLKPKGTSVGIFHPGFVQTDMVNNAGDISPAEAASRLIALIDTLNLNNSGTFWHSNGEVLPW